MRVQLAGEDFLQLAEVKVLAPAANSPAAKINPEGDGLVNYWTFDDPDDGFAGDLAGQAVGVAYNAKRVEGKIGKAIDFAKADQRVETPSTAGMDFTANDSFTLSAWIDVRRPTGGWHGIISKRLNGTTAYGLLQSIRPDDSARGMPNNNLFAGAQATPQ